MSRTRKTLRFDDAAYRALRRADGHGKRQSAAAVNVWADVVGPDISSHTKGFALREDRELQIFVDSAAWANQLSLMSSELQERLNARLGEDSVRSLRFTVSKKVNDAIVQAAQAEHVQEFYAIDPTTPAPLSQVELSQARAVASAIKDEALREAALKAMIKDLELKKGGRTKKGR